MRTFKDIHTNKIFYIEGEKVTDQFGNVATIPAHDWLLMQGADLLLVAVDGVSVEGEKLATGKTTKFRSKDKYKIHRGCVHMVVDCQSEALGDRVFEAFKEAGFDGMVFDSDKWVEGVSLIMLIPSDELEEFTEEYKRIKQLVK
ncbi:coil containing protein [Vibrio phage 1.121.O._10N.286.46.C4]|nr:coil containing protein [Vibrio phage 1.121.O._10N.286.46.C4]